MELDVLVVEDEIEIAELISDILTDAKFSVRIAKNSIEALAEIEAKVPNVLILDIWLQDSPLDGLGILEKVKALYKLLPVIMISGHGTVANIVHAIKVGAYDYITKPFSQDKLLLTVQRAYEAAQLKKENKNLKNKLDFENKLIGNSDIIQKLNLDIKKIPQNAKNILLIGAPGTEKETVARLLHSSSNRANRPLLYLRTSNLTSQEIDEKIFGKADLKQNGCLIPQASESLLKQGKGGTIYIPNLIDLNLLTQTKLAKALYDDLLEKQKNDVRVIIGICEQDIKLLIQQNKLDPNLYQKLQSYKIRIPKISERKEDIKDICNYLLKQICFQHDKKQISLSDEILKLFEEYPWDENIAEIKNTLEWLVIKLPYNNKKASLTEQNLSEPVLNNPPSVMQLYNKIKHGQFIMHAEQITINKINTNLSLKEARAIFEKDYLASQMRKMNNNVSKTAKVVGMERSALHRKLAALNISLPFNSKIDN
jgi:two-component system nitrogen regulation response regulator NtrX